MTFLAIQLRRRVRRRGKKHSCTRGSVCVLEDVEHRERLGHGSVGRTRSLGSDVMTVTQPREPASRFVRVSCFNSLDVDRRVHDWVLTDFGLC